MNPSRVLSEERAENRGFGGVLVGLVVDPDGLHGGAEDVGKQDELLAPFIGDVADGG